MPFYVRQDPQSKHIAAFAAVNGWVILGTREDLVAGVLDRLQSANERSLADEAWYADSVKQASGAPGDLRMVLNLGKLIPSPYFRSYWVQQNITEMKQYASAVSDLYRSARTYREERVLLRKPGIATSPLADVSGLASLAPAGADFDSAQAVSNPETVLTALRDNPLEMTPATAAQPWNAPSAPPETQASSAAMLDVRIDQAPVFVAESDPFDTLHTLLRSVQPSELLQVASSIAPPGSNFIRIQSGVIVGAAQSWDAPAIERAVSAALQPGQTAGRRGLDWLQHTAAHGSYFALDGRVPLYFAVRGNLLYFANAATLLEQMLALRPATTPAQQSGLTFTAVFRNSAREQENFNALFSRIDRTGTAGAEPGNQAPPFFSGNIESLGRMFQNVEQESVTEHDQGTKVLQTVSYNWKH